ncbi:MAG: 7-carboxy-7-deazaguanine synthase QueE [Candidatus Bathyarchaeota archaeon]|nr:7-carboxy-7-deazaguanine synthase QueE [Candidatus Bathyarchaeota archaeon]
MNVCEIFHSIEGEGIEIGIPQVFVRLTGCNLRCHWCDTKYSWLQGKEMVVSDVVEEIAKYPCRTVSITGGEPLLQKAELKQLLSKLKDEKYRLCVNTNGTIFDKTIFDEVDLITMDCKCPSSGEASDLKILQSTQSNYGQKTQFKFVVSDEDDYVYARQIIESILLNGKSILILQPQWSNKPFFRKLSRLILADGLPVRLILQQHKVIWGEKRGV